MEKTLVHPTAFDVVFESKANADIRASSPELFACDADCMNACAPILVYLDVTWILCSCVKRTKFDIAPEFDSRIYGGVLEW